MSAPGGLGAAEDHPVGCTVVVRRERAGTELLVLHRPALGAYDADGAWTPPEGRRRPGEPVQAAAQRGLREETGIEHAEVWAVDLSGRWAVLAADVPDDVAVALRHPGRDGHAWLRPDEAVARLRAGEGLAVDQVARAGSVPRVTLAFRPLTRADFASVVAWQSHPYVARWWQDEARDVATAERHYGPALAGDDPTRMWVAEVNGRSVGLLQDYRIGDHPEYALLTARPDAVGVDYLIGEPSWVGTGVGTRLLWGYLRDVVVPHYPGVREVFAAPDHRNVASLRVLDKLGFTRGLWFDEPQSDGRVDTVVGCTLDVARCWGGAERVVTGG